MSSGYMGLSIWPKLTLKSWFLVRMWGYSAWPPSWVLFTRYATPWSTPLTWRQRDDKRIKNKH